MKNIATLLFICYSLTGIAQVAIGKSELSKIQPANTVTNPSISLEFYDQADNARGIVLPWVSTVADNPVAYNATTGVGYSGMKTPIEDGTLIMDLSDKYIKYRKNGSWFNLSGDIVYPLTVRTGSTDVIINAPTAIDTSLQDNQKEQDNAKVIIGGNADIDMTNGILVLTDKDRAMVLPRVASPHLNIKNPAAGMMVYDTAKKQFAVFNGTVWSFWKP